MPSLPLPSLDPALSQYLKTASVVLNLEQYHLLEQRLNASDTKERLEQAHQTLSAYAQTQDELSKSWVSDFWHTAYVAGRAPVALSSNVGFELDLSALNKTGISRAAEWIVRLTHTHLAYLNGHMEPLRDGRGNALSMNGFQVLKGAMREPKSEVDGFYYSQQGTANRHINILHNGHHGVLRVSNAQGEARSVACIARELTQFVSQTQTPHPKPFCQLSALPSKSACAHLEALCQNADNQALYQTLKDGLFCLSLFASGQSATDQLREQTFLPGTAWHFKPFTYQLDLNSDFAVVHVEHTGLDGGDINAMMEHALAHTINEVNDDADHAVQLSHWQMSDDQWAAITADLKPVGEHARAMALEVFTVLHGIEGKISHDALIQFSLQYAQLKTFGRLRSTYESVDTRHYVAGRTECLRPNTPESRALCEKLLHNNATAQDLEPALLAHKQWVIACKTGQAFDRLLFALRNIEVQPDAGDFDLNSVLAALGGDFLSTSTLGSQYPIKRFVFAPTSEGGFGVNYGVNAQEYEYCLIADAQSAAHIDAFKVAIGEGVVKLAALIAPSNH